jgi:hypothetical protein
MGMNVQDLTLTQSGLTDVSGETWFATIPNYSPGFSVGLVGDLYLNNYLNLRLTPMLHFGEKSFEFVEQESHQNYKVDIRSNYITLPLDFKFRASRVNNYRPYVLAGVYTAMDLGRKTDEAVYLKAMDYGISIGIGCDFYLPLIKVIPELRFSFGLTDIVEHSRTDLTQYNLLKYSNAIAKGRTRMISFVFNFE